MDYFHRHDESVVYRSRQHHTTPQYTPSEYCVYCIQMRYITNSGARRVREYRVGAFSPAAARRKAGDIFRCDYPRLRLQ